MRRVEFVLALGVLGTLLALWVGWTATRLDRLAGRTRSARASLEAQLVRRAAAAEALADLDAAALGARLAGRLRAAARLALTADPAGREGAENELGRLLGELPDGPDPHRLRDLADATARVALARRFYNDAVRDTRALRGNRLTRLFRLAAHRPAPLFFDIADPDLVRRTRPPAVASRR